MVLALWLAACAPPPWEVDEPVARVAPAREDGDAPFSGTASWRAGGRVARLDGRALVVDGARVGEGLIAAPAAAGPTLAWSEEGSGVERVVAMGAGAPVELARDVRADHLAVSPDGAWVAWVAPVDGLAGVWIASADGSSAPRPLTNVGLARPAGGPPPGWVPPPKAPPRFDGDTLRWDGGEVRWR